MEEFTRSSTPIRQSICTDRLQSPFAERIQLSFAPRRRCQTSSLYPTRWLTSSMSLMILAQYVSETCKMQSLSLSGWGRRRVSLSSNLLTLAQLRFSRRNLPTSNRRTHRVSASDHSAVWLLSLAAMRSSDLNATKLTHQVRVLATRLSPLALKSRLLLLSSRSSTRRMKVNGTQRKLLRQQSKCCRQSSPVTSRQTRSRSDSPLSISPDSENWVCRRLTLSSMKWMMHCEHTILQATSTICLLNSLKINSTFRLDGKVTLHATLYSPSLTKFRSIVHTNKLLSLN